MHCGGSQMLVQCLESTEQTRGKHCGVDIADPFNRSIVCDHPLAGCCWWPFYAPENCRARHTPLIHIPSLQCIMVYRLGNELMALDMLMADCLCGERRDPWPISPTMHASQWFWSDNKISKQSKFCGLGALKSPQVFHDWRGMKKTSYCSFHTRHHCQWYWVILKVTV